MGDLRSAYRFLIGDLQGRGYRVITMDLLGMSDSTINWRDYSESSIVLDIVSLINQLELKSATLIGNSISADAAVIMPPSILILFQSCARFPVCPQCAYASLQAVFVQDCPCKALGASVWTAYQSSRLYTSMKHPDMQRYSLSAKAMLRKKGRMKAFQKMAVTNHNKAKGNVEHMNIPAMVIMDSRDPDFPDPKKEFDWLSARTSAKCVMFEGAGHYPQA